MNLAMVWQPDSRVDKTATALQVTLFSTLRPRQISESEISLLSSRWIEFMNSVETLV